MNTLITIIFIFVGILAIVVFPKIIRWAIFLAITYLTIFKDLLFGIAYIPLLLLIWYFRRKL